MIPALSGVELSSGIDRRTGRRGEDSGSGELFHDALGRASGAPDVRDRSGAPKAGDAPEPSPAPGPEDSGGTRGEAGTEPELAEADAHARAQQPPTGEAGGPHEPEPGREARIARVESPAGERRAAADAAAVPSSPVPARPKDGGADGVPPQKTGETAAHPKGTVDGVTGADEAPDGRGERPTDGEPVRPSREARWTVMDRGRVRPDVLVWPDRVRAPRVSGADAVVADAGAEAAASPAAGAGAAEAKSGPATSAPPVVRAEVAGPVVAPGGGAGGERGGQGEAWREDRGASAGAQGAPTGGAVKTARVEPPVAFEASGAAGGEGAEARAATAQGGEAAIGVRVGGAQKLSLGSAGTAGHGVQDAQSTGFEGAVTRGFSAVMRQNGGSVVIRLIPETLGPVRISMTLDKSSVSVMLDASTAQAHELLTSNLGSLRQSLESQGLRVDRMGVTLTHAGPPSPGPTGADSVAHHRGSEDPGGGGQDAAGGRSRGHSDQSSRDRRGGAHADPTPPFGSFSELIEASGEPMRFVATA